MSDKILTERWLHTGWSGLDEATARRIAGSRPWRLRYTSRPERLAKICASVADQIRTGQPLAVSLFVREVLDLVAGVVAELGFRRRQVRQLRDQLRTMRGDRDRWRWIAKDVAKATPRGSLRDVDSWRGRPGGPMHLADLRARGRLRKPPSRVPLSLHVDGATWWPR